MADVLLTYGWVRSSYSALRNLGKHNLEVSVSDSSSIGMSQFSKFSSGFNKYKSHYEDENKFIADILDICSSKEVKLILPIGKILRKTKINELPQLINIFIGDMSVIGPRPQTQRCFDAFSLVSQKEIIKVSPGLSGVGSIFFRNEEDMLAQAEDSEEFYDNTIMPYKGKLEEWYLANRNILNYFILIGATVLVIFGVSTKNLRIFFPNLPNPPRSLDSWV